MEKYVGYKYEIIKGQNNIPVKIMTHSEDKIITHWHDYMEILMVLKGEVTIKIYDKDYTLKERDVYIINKYELHSISKISKDNIMLLVQIDVEHYSKYYSQFKNMIFENNYFNEKENKEKSDILKKHLSNIVYELNKKDEVYKFIVASEIKLLLAHIIKNSKEKIIPEDLLKSRNTKLYKIKEILDCINKNFDKKISLTMIANKVYLSNAHISRFFKDMMGMTYQEYINSLRLNKATELLLSTSKLVSEIALESGFASTKSLNELFRQSLDCTPSEYRKKYANKK